MRGRVRVRVRVRARARERVRLRAQLRRARLRRARLLRRRVGIRAQRGWGCELGGGVDGAAGGEEEVEGEEAHRADRSN